VVSLYLPQDDKTQVAKVVQALSEETCVSVTTTSLSRSVSRTASTTIRFGGCPKGSGSSQPARRPAADLAAPTLGCFLHLGSAYHGQMITSGEGRGGLGY
jgi:hypothetical protein